MESIHLSPMRSEADTGQFMNGMAGLLHFCFII